MLTNKGSTKVKLSWDSVKAVVRAAFPNYKGRTIRLCTADSDTEYPGGGGTFYSARWVDLGAMTSTYARDAGSEESAPHCRVVTLTMDKGMALVKRSYFCGKDKGIEITLAPVDLATWSVALDAFLEGDEDAVDCPKATAVLEAANYSGAELELLTLLLESAAKSVTAEAA